MLYFKNISGGLYGIGLGATMGFFAGIYTLGREFRIVHYLFLIALLAYQFLLNSELAIAFYILKIEYEFYTSKLVHLHLETYYFIRCVFLKHNKPVGAANRASTSSKRSDDTDLHYYKMLVTVVQQG